MLRGEMGRGCLCSRIVGSTLTPLLMRVVLGLPSKMIEDEHGTEMGPILTTEENTVAAIVHDIVYQSRHAFIIDLQRSSITLSLYAAPASFILCSTLSSPGILSMAPLISTAMAAATPALLKHFSTTSLSAGRPLPPSMATLETR